MSEQTDSELMVGSTVYQVAFEDEIQDIILFSSLSKERADNFVQQIKDYDAGFIKGSEHDLDGSYDAAHPLASWREDICGGGSLVEDLAELSTGTWEVFFVRSEFVLG